MVNGVPKAHSGKVSTELDDIHEPSTSDEVTGRPSDTASDAGTATVSESGVATGSRATKTVWFLRDKPFGWFLVISSLIGFAASFELSIDKVKLLENPDAVLSCDFNPFFSCGNVMAFPQSQIFGFPNQFMGIAAFVVPLLIGLLFISRVQLPRWFLLGLNLGLLGGVVLVMYLFYSSIFAIGIGCPWCIVVWTVTIPMFCVVTGYNVLTGNFGAGVRDNVFARILAKEAVALSILWMFLIYAAIVIRFWTYFSTFF